MPRLPSEFDLGPAPIPTPSGGVVDANARPGSGLAELGGTIFEAAQKFQERADTVKVEDAFNQLRKKQLDLTIGDKGFARLRGGDAVNRPLFKDYTTQFDSARDELMNGLQNDVQREKFKARAAAANLQFQEDLLRHSIQQADVYARDTTRAVIDTELQNATARWEDPSAIMSSIMRSDSAISLEGERLGWDAKTIKAAQQEAATKIHASVIGQALAAERPEYAQRWYEEHRENIAPATAQLLRREVAQGAQKEAYAVYQREYMDVSDSVEGLTALRGVIGKDDALHEDRKNQLMWRIESRIDTLNAAEERRVAQQRALVGKAIDDVNAQTLRGYIPSGEQMEKLADAAIGDPMLEPAARSMQMLAEQTRQFIGMSPVQRESTIAKLESLVRVDPSRFDEKTLEAFKSIDRSMNERVRKDPLTFAQSMGIAEIGQLDLQKPLDASTQLTDRYAMARSLAYRYQAPMKPITEEEARGYTEALRRMPIEGRMVWFRDLWAASKGDNEGYAALMGQLGRQDSVISAAGALASKEGGEAPAVLALRGDNILRPPSEPGKPERTPMMRMPPEKDIHSRFDMAMRDAFGDLPAEAAEQHYQLAKSIYAAMTYDAGDGHPDIFSPSRWDKAVQMAGGNVTNYRSHKTIMPYGWSESQWTDALDAQLKALAASGRLAPDMTLSKLRDLPVSAVGEGIYILRSGDMRLIDKEGKDIVLDLGRTQRLVDKFLIGGPASLGVAAEPGESPQFARLLNPTTPRPAAPAVSAPAGGPIPLPDGWTVYPRQPDAATPEQPQRQDQAPGIGEKPIVAPATRSELPPGTPLPAEPSMSRPAAVEQPERELTAPDPAQVPSAPQGLIEPGNIDLNARPVVRNADGTYSTVRSMSFEDFHGREVLIPTISDSGKVLSDDEAIAEYKRTGRHLGIFDNAENANAYANHLHSQQDKQYRGAAEKGAAPGPQPSPQKGAATITQPDRPTAVVAPTRPEEVPGMVRVGNTDYRRAVDSMVIYDGRFTVVIPTRGWDGKVWTETEAVQRYRSTGVNLGQFVSDDAARDYVAAVQRDAQTLRPGTPGTMPPSSPPVAQPAVSPKMPARVKSIPDISRPDAYAPPPPQMVPQTGPPSQLPKPASMINEELSRELIRSTNIRIEIPKAAKGEPVSSPDRQYPAAPQQPQPSKYDATFSKWEAALNLPAGVLRSIAMHESRLNPNASHANKNGTNDAGIMQINSAHLREGEVDWRKDADKSIAYGAKVFANALKQAQELNENTGAPTRADVVLAYQIYNGGAKGYASKQARTNAAKFAQQWDLVQSDPSVPLSTATPVGRLAQWVNTLPADQQRKLGEELQKSRRIGNGSQRRAWQLSVFSKYGAPREVITEIQEQLR